MDLLHLLLVVALVLAVIATALGLFLAWQRNPAAIQRRVKKTFTYLLVRPAAVAGSVIMSITTIIVSAPLVIGAVALRIACGKPATLNIKVS